jgi:hypothetical protein
MSTTRKKYSVSPDEFVAAWTDSATTAEVAKRLAMPRQVVLARASAYRRRGVRLKPLKRLNPRRLDVERLNQLAAAALQGEPGIRVDWDGDAPGISLATL